MLNATAGPAGAQIWASLTDGTPLVSAAPDGQGWRILFHTTADPRWSDLALSGTYVEMLQRLLPFAAVAGTQRGDGPKAPVKEVEDLFPLSRLDAFGANQAPDSQQGPIPARALVAEPVSAAMPPGLYGTNEQPIAVNLAAPQGPIGPNFRWRRLGNLPASVGRVSGLGQGEFDLAPALLAACFLLFLADVLFSLALRGLLPGARQISSTVLLGTLIAAGMLAWPPQLSAQADPAMDHEFIAQATSNTRLAYVMLGDDRIDAMSKAGLGGLGTLLSRRTAIRPAPPLGVDLDVDPLGVFSFVYWPLAEDAADLSPQAIANLNGFLRTGGLLFIDTGLNETQLRTIPVINAGVQATARRVLAPLDLPALSPLTSAHVLAKSFYLLERFPGRHADRPVWVEANTEGDNGRLTSVILGDADWAKAWATAPNGMPLYYDFAGGLRQRELANRFGVNAVVYALTGTYKADQLHLPALLERLSQ